MSTPRLAYSHKLWCSFCGKAADEVEKLIAGPTVFICNECVGLCQDIMNLEAEPNAPRPAFTEAQETRAAEIAFGIVADVVQGTDARIRDTIAAALNGHSSSAETQCAPAPGERLRGNAACAAFAAAQATDQITGEP